MAFPGKFDISYYRGDTYEFKIYPKDTSGASYSLSSFTSSDFTISTERGPAGVSDRKFGYTEISQDGTYILCVITPETGQELSFGNNYVYDIEVSKPGTPYDTVITLVSGNITMTEQVSGAV